MPKIAHSLLLASSVDNVRKVAGGMTELTTTHPSIPSSSPTLLLVMADTRGGHAPECSRARYPFSPWPSSRRMYEDFTRQ